MRMQCAASKAKRWLGFPLWSGSPALLVELKAAGMKHNVLGVPRLCQFFAPPRSRSGSKRQACPKMRSLPTGSQLSDCFLSTKSAGEPPELNDRHKRDLNRATCGRDAGQHPVDLARLGEAE